MPLNLSIFYKKDFLKSREEKKRFKGKINLLIEVISEKEGKRFSSIGIIFCSDRYIKKINKKFLDHDYETDIITFHDIDDEGSIEGELFISVDFVKKNSVIYNSSFRNEIKRVIIHGILHLCGYNDKTVKQRSKMRSRENYYLTKI
jgi:probable rRNA maturation factor